MSPNEVLEEYKLVIFRAKLVSACSILLAIPKLVIGLSDRTSFIGISSNESLVLFIIGFSIYVFFGFKYWKCPACKKFPGSGWSRNACENCGVCLSGTNSH